MAAAHTTGSTRLGKAFNESYQGPQESFIMRIDAFIALLSTAWTAAGNFLART